MSAPPKQKHKAEMKLRQVAQDVKPEQTRLEEGFADLMGRAAATITPKLKQQIEQTVEALCKERYNRGFMEGSRRY